MAKRTKRATKKQERQDARPFPHSNGLWAKKCRGKLVYLGSIKADPTGEKAWLRWLDERDDRRAGRTPTKHREGLTVAELANHWLTSKSRLLESGELAPVTFDNYKSFVDLLVAELGSRRRVLDLKPAEFALLRAAMARRWGPQRLRAGVVIVRTIIKYAYEAELIEKPVRFGSEFNVPSARALRQARHDNGPRMFRPEQIRALLDVATPVEKVLILLGANAAMGPTDIGCLETSAVDQEAGWLDWPRRKTAVPRRIPLWPETLAAIHAWLDTRPRAKPGQARFLLLSKQGRRINRCSLAPMFQRAARKAGVEGRAFYDFRRTFATIGEHARDPAALSAILGHAPRGTDMQAVYRQQIEDDRLRAVANAVRNWVFAPRETG